MNKTRTTRQNKRKTNNKQYKQLITIRLIINNIRVNNILN